MKFLRLLLLLVITSGCASTSGPSGERATLRLRVEPEDARVTLDDRAVGRARGFATQPRVVEPGLHIVTLEAEGYFPHDLDLDLPPGETLVEVRLRPVPR